MSKEIRILHLFPDILDLYGDKGNIECLKKRLIWRGIKAEVTECTESSSQFDAENADIIFLGGASDRELWKVSQLLASQKKDLKEFVERGGVFLALCGGFQLVGSTFKTPDYEIEGLGILDIASKYEESDKRLIGDVVLECEGLGKIVGFENHAARVNIENYTPLGKVVLGFGNDENSKYEGVVYKNLIASNLHGPLLPKNPKLCDRILTNALKHKYSDFSALSPLDDSVEIAANEYIIQNFLKNDTK